MSVYVCGHSSYVMLVVCVCVYSIYIDVCYICVCVCVCVGLVDDRLYVH